MTEGCPRRVWQSRAEINSLEQFGEVAQPCGRVPKPSKASRRLMDVWTPAEPRAVMPAVSDSRAESPAVVKVLRAVCEQNELWEAVL